MMNMEETREIVREFFKKYEKNTRDYPELCRKTLKQVSNGHWNFDEYYIRMRDASGIMSNERHAFLIRHSQFLIAYNEYILGVLSDAGTSNVYHFMKRRQKSIDRLNKLTSCEIQAQLTV